MAHQGIRVRKKGTVSSLSSSSDIISLPTTTAAAAIAPVTNLLEATLASSTVTKYNKATTLFLQWLSRHNYSPTTYQQLDSLLSIYLNEMYSLGTGKAAANSTVFGLNIIQPGISDHLPTSKKILKGYNKLKPSTRHPPLTWPITCVIALDMIQRGEFTAGVITLLAFDSYLRINEVLGLYHEDVALGSDVRIGAGRPDRMYLRLRKTKTGPEQGVEVLNADVKILVLMVQSRTRVGSKLFNYSDDQYRSLFRHVCDDLKLPRDYVPHSLRHGGATYGYLNDMSFTDIQVRGRWASLKSCVNYVQTFRQALISRSFPPSITLACDLINSKPLLTAIGEILLSRERLIIAPVD